MKCLFMQLPVKINAVIMDEHQQSIKLFPWLQLTKDLDIVGSFY